MFVPDPMAGRCTIETITTCSKPADQRLAWPDVGLGRLVSDINRVQAAVSLLYRRALEDPRLVPHFDGVDLVRVARHQRAFLAAAVGGERAYRGFDLHRTHVGLGLGNADVDAMIGHAAQSLADVGVSEDGVQGAAHSRN